MNDPDAMQGYTSTFFTFLFIYGHTILPTNLEKATKHKPTGI